MLIVRQHNGYKKLFHDFFLFSWMGKLHDRLSNLGWDRVHRSFEETKNVHVAEGWGEIVGQVEREEHGVAYVKGRQDLKDLKRLERVG